MTRITRGLIPLAIFVVAFVCFLPAVDGQFLNWDDRENLVENTGFRGLGWTQLRWMFTATVLGHYIPITWMTFGLNYALGGMNPWGYHLLNMLLHAANAGLFYLVARRLLVAGLAGASMGSWPIAAGAAFAALVFGVHPLRVESVAWITERRDVLCGLFFLLAVLAWLRATERPGCADRRWQVVSLVAFAASLLSKAAAMPLPAVLLLLDVYPLRRVKSLGWRAVLVEKLPHAVLGGAAAVLSLVVLRISTVAITSYHDYGIGARVAMTGYSLVFYPWKLVWPSPLSPIYELPARVDLLAPQFLIPILALVTVTAVLVAIRRRWPGGLAAWGYSALMVLPVSGAVHAGFQLAHDRYSYLSGLGFAVLAGAALTWALDGGGRRRLSGPVAALVSVCALLLVLIWGADSWRQSRIWRDSETLWRWALDVDPTCAICHNNLGSVILESPPFTPERARVAEHHFREAIRLHPERPNAYHNLGAALAVQKRYPEAEAAFRDFMVRHPEAVSGPGSLGVLLLEEKRFAEAVSLLRQAQAMAPNARELKIALATALRGRAQELADSSQHQDAAALEQEARQLESDAQRSTTSGR